MVDILQTGDELPRLATAIITDETGRSLASLEVNMEKLYIQAQIKALKWALENLSQEYATSVHILEKKLAELGRKL